MRKESIVRIEDGGETKEFKVRQMSASQGERFLFKVILLVGGQAKAQLLKDPVALLGALADKPYDAVQELLDEMLSCASIIHGGVETQLNNSNVDGFIESSTTLLQLRGEVFKVNNFFPKGAQTPLNAFKDTSEPTIKRRG